MPRYENKEWEEKTVIGLGQRNSVGHVSKERALFEVATKKKCKKTIFYKDLRPQKQTGQLKLHINRAGIGISYKLKIMIGVDN